MKTYPIEELIHPRERKYFWAMAIFSVLMWIVLVVGTFGIGLIYLVIGAIVTFSLKSIYVAMIKGFGVRVNERQYPDIHAEVVRISMAVGMKRPPETYVFHQNGVLNAFALNIFSRKFIVLTTHMLEACGDDKDLLAFIVGHEIGHHVRKHTSRAGFLAPGRIIPWLGNAYSRACEYTCDAIGAQFGPENLERAGRGISILATANYRRGTSLDVESYLEQARDVREFWPAVAYSNSSHPFTAMRLARLHDIFNPGDINRLPRANTLGMFVSPIFSLMFLIVLFYGFFIVAAVDGIIDGMKKQGLLIGGPKITMTMASRSSIVKYDPSPLLSENDGVTFGKDKAGQIDSITTKFGRYRWSPSAIGSTKGLVTLPSITTPLMEEPRGIVFEAVDGDYGTIDNKPCKMTTTLYFLNLQNLVTSEVARFESLGKAAGDLCSSLTIVGREGSRVLLHAQEFDPEECGPPVWSGDPKKLFSFELSDPRSGLKPYVPSPEVVTREQEERIACLEEWEEATRSE